MSLEDLGDRIAEMAAHIHAVTFRLLLLIARFDREFEESGGGTGFRSTAHWLSWRTGIGLGAAREKVRVARALEHLPRFSESMEKGALSFSKVRALTRVATADNEHELLEIALRSPASHLERLVRAWRRTDRLEEAADDERRHRSRALTLYPDVDGTWVIRGRLEPEVGALLERALTAARDECWKEGRGGQERANTPDERSPRQKRADALAQVAAWALDGGMPKRRSGQDRYRVVVHVDEARLSPDADGAEAADTPLGGEANASADTNPAAQSCLEDGIHVSAETSRRLACGHAGTRRAETRRGETRRGETRPGGTRRVSTSLRRALERRDRSCRFPGCGLRICDAHHVQHWADGGATELENLVLLCRRHHRAVHEGGFQVSRSKDGRFRFLRPDGRALPASPSPPPVPERPLDSLVADNAARGIAPHPWTPTPEWHGETLDPGLALAMLRR